jgi:3-oxoacyl-[acyl-carrier protein] reductase
MENRFSGHSVLVTGSTSGIGLAVARGLVSGGASVILHGRRSEQDLSSEAKGILSDNDDVFYLQADLSKPTDALELPHRAAELSGKLTGLVLNAAVTIHKDWLSVTPEDWDRTMSINLKSQMILAQAATPFLRETRGSIVVVSSTNAIRVNKKNFVYDSGKAALNHMARAWALELKDDAVRVNVVMPGGVDSPMLSDWLVDYAGSEVAAKEVLEQGKQSGLVAVPEDIAGPILFLLSEDARWVTGASIVVDGGGLLQN